MNQEFRLMILMGVRDGKKIVEMAKDIDRCQQIVSRYLTALREEGLIIQELGAKGKNAKRNSRKLTDKGKEVLNGKGISTDRTPGTSGNDSSNGEAVRTKVPTTKTRKPRERDGIEVPAVRDMAQGAVEKAVPFIVIKCLPWATSTHAGEHEEPGLIDGRTVTERDEQHIGGAQ